MAKLLNEIHVAKAPLLPPMEDPALFARAKKVVTVVPSLFRHVAPVPWVADMALLTYEKPCSHLPDAYAPLATLVVAQENSCRYCYGAMRSLMRELGYGEAQINRLERDLELAELDPSMHVALGFCRKLARSMPRPVKAEAEQLVRQGMSREAVAELAFAVALASISNRLASFLMLGEHPLERAEPSLVRRVAEALFKKPRPAPPGPVDARGPYEPVVRALDGLHAGHALRRTLDAAFASPILPRRAKALMFAVVARTLACSGCDAESRALCGLAPSDAERLLSDFAAPELDPLERHLLPFARASVHYDPQPIHEQLTRLRDAIGPEQTLEAIGVAALANSVVRLGMFAQ